MYQHGQYKEIKSFIFDMDKLNSTAAHVPSALKCKIEAINYAPCSSASVIFAKFLYHSGAINNRNRVYRTNMKLNVSNL